MWFPYSLPANFRVEGDRQCADKSALDDSSREFLIACQLRNPISNDLSVELRLSEPRLLKWKEPTGDFIQISLFPNDGGRLSEIVTKLADTRLQKAVERCHLAVSMFLDFWSSTSGRGFSVAGIRAADLKHNARWRAMPHWPSALDLPLAPPKELPDGFWSAAQLYREGRTSSKDRYRFLCCYALVGKWSRAEPPFQWKNKNSPRIKELASATVNRETMALSGAMLFAPELEGLPIEDLPDALAPWHARAMDWVAGGLEDATRNNFSSLQEWAAIANVVDIAAHTILSRTIACWDKTPSGAGHSIKQPVMT